jgi:D-sedoheptulose 7-phosphate isomerase
MIKPMLDRALGNLAVLLPKLAALEPALQRLGETLLGCWEKRGKVLIAGNGGSAADAMHFAEELVVRFRRNRRALAAIALCGDPSVLTCAGNDFGYDQVFARQVDALGNPGDVLVVFSTSGNSANLLRAVEAAKQRQMSTAAFLGPEGGRARGMCDIEFLVPCAVAQHVQEAHQLLYHVLCEWVDSQVE